MKRLWCSNPKFCLTVDRQDQRMFLVADYLNALDANYGATA